MAIRSMRDWIDLVALIAVVAGLFLVAYEVRQANDIATVEAENSVYQGWESLSMAEVETGIHRLFFKSMEDPTSLTPVEKRDLGSWLVAVMSIVVRSEISHQHGLVDVVDHSWWGPDYFQGQFARDWFRENESWIRDDAPNAAEAISKYIASTPPVPTSAPDGNQ